MKTTTEKTVEAKPPLTMDQIDSKASELTTKYDNKVTPVVITVDGEQIVGYFQEPNFDVLMYSVDMYIDKKISMAAEATFRDCLLKEESDKRISSSERKHAKIKGSFHNACLKFVTPYVDEYKKK